MRYIHDDKDMILEELLDDIKEDTERCMFDLVLYLLFYLKFVYRDNINVCMIFTNVYILE